MLSKGMFMVVIGIIGVIVSVALLLRAIFKSSAKATKQPIHSDETEKLLESTGTPQQAAIVEATRTLEETRILEETVHLHSAVKKNEHVVETTLLATDKEKKQSIEIPTILLLDEEKEQQTQSNFNKKNNSDEENSVAATVLLKAKEQEM
ncbi:hypothetical protein GCM10020331_055560 [Ectobacillus funiculus]